ncbi:MAG TPA: hypothetical protein VJM46_00270 [Candidatus Saccharimonadales bacterium]|nr:hypothetical protein [Candidatus Saccharimonadales bacterium]
MSVETRDQREFERYLTWQREQRPQRIETLGTAATSLVLATFDMGISDVHDPERTPRRQDTVEHDSAGAEVISLRATRERRLAGFATESAELGYAKAA